MESALERFRAEFVQWVAAHTDATGYAADPNELLSQLNGRIPESIQIQIGAALLNGWLRTDHAYGRGYCLRESDPETPLSKRTLVCHVGNAKVSPCWELYVQLADYGRLRTIADAKGLFVRLEDHLMDIAVWAGNSLLLYVENKESRSDALRLLEGMQTYGESGFSLDAPDKSNDPLRKSKYLFRNDARPKYFAVSAVGFQQLFAVEYLGDKNCFRLLELSDPITTPLHHAAVDGRLPARCVADSFALELDRRAGEQVWVSTGSGATAFNVYLPCNRRDSIMLGVYETGEIWTDNDALGIRLTQRLSNELRVLGIALDFDKRWSFWVRDGKRFRISNEEGPLVASAIVRALFPEMK